jgi:hypothetical protein
MPWHRACPEGLEIRPCDAKGNGLFTTRALEEDLARAIFGQGELNNQKRAYYTHTHIYISYIHIHTHIYTYIYMCIIKGYLGEA